MAVILVTGMSGAGKSTALGELGRRGHHVVDTDEGDYVEDVVLPGAAQPERLWREDKVVALLDAHSTSAFSTSAFSMSASVGRHLFVQGTVANQGRLYPRFDAVVLLSAPLEVLLERVAARTTNDFGKADHERERIVADVADVEPLLRAGATLEIDTRRPVAEVVAALEDLAARADRSSR